jgi:hypothetical protein
MDYAKLGFWLSLINTLYCLNFNGLMFFSYFTYWCLVLHIIALYSVSYGLEKQEITRKLLITSWSMGWTVTIMFWSYVFPLIDGASLPPVWNYVLNHGGVHALIVTYLYNNRIKTKVTDIKWPILVFAIYIFAVILPLRSYGVIVYPLFFEKLVPTVIILLATLSLLALSFGVQYYSLNIKQKDN